MYSKRTSPAIDSLAVLELTELSLRTSRHLAHNYRAPVAGPLSCNGVRALLSLLALDRLMGLAYDNTARFEGFEY